MHLTLIYDYDLNRHIITHLRYCYGDLVLVVTRSDNRLNILLYERKCYYFESTSKQYKSSVTGFDIVVSLKCLDYNNAVVDNTNGGHSNERAHS